MKRIILALTVMCFAGGLAAAELMVQGDSMTFGTQKFTVGKNGTLLFFSNGKWVSGFGVSVATKHKSRWFTPGMPLCKPELKPGEKGVWDFSAKIPADETDFVDLSIRTTVTPFNTIELDTAWKTPDRKNILELGMFLTIPMKEIAGKDIVMNGQNFKVVNETKYGWVNKTLENPEITVFKGEAGVEYTVSGNGRFNIVFQSGKDQSFVVRFYPAAEEMKLTVTPK